MCLADPVGNGSPETAPNKEPGAEEFDGRAATPSVLDTPLLPPGRTPSHHARHFFRLCGGITFGKKMDKGDTRIPPLLRSRHR